MYCRVTLNGVNSDWIEIKVGRKTRRKNIDIFVVALFRRATGEFRRKQSWNMFKFTQVW